MYCQTPEENALLEKLLAQYPDSDRLTMNLVAWMWINQRDAYERAIAMLQADYVNPEDIPLVSNTDEKYAPGNQGSPYPSLPGCEEVKEGLREPKVPVEELKSMH